MKSLKINTVCAILALLISHLAPIVMFAQVPAGDYANATDAKGLKQGPWKKMDENGTCIYVGQFKDDKPVGVFTYFDTDGRKMSEMDFKTGGPVVYAKMFYINGFIQAEGKYINQLKDSTWHFYTDYKNGELLSEETYVKGKKEGKSTVFHPGTTKPASITFYKNGIEEGAYVEYYLDGVKKEDATFVHGLLEGKATWYCPDGKISILGNYEHSLKHGNWVYYDCTGKIKGKETWDKGKLTSQEQLIKPEDVKTNTQDVPGLNGQDPNEGIPR